MTIGFKKGYFQKNAIYPLHFGQFHFSVLITVFTVTKEHSIKRRKGSDQYIYFKEEQST